MSPLFKTSVIEEFEIFGYNKRDDSVRQAFLEHNQSSYPAISFLEWMDGLKLLVEVNNKVDATEVVGGLDDIGKIWHKIAS